jgi:hypothetical protein
MRRGGWCYSGAGQLLWAVGDGRWASIVCVCEERAAATKSKCRCNAARLPTLCPKKTRRDGLPAARASTRRWLLHSRRPGMAHPCRRPAAHWPALQQEKPGA